MPQGTMFKNMSMINIKAIKCRGLKLLFWDDFSPREVYYHMCIDILKVQQFMDMKKNAKIKF